MDRNNNLSRQIFNAILIMSASLLIIGGIMGAGWISFLLGFSVVVYLLSTI